MKKIILILNFLFVLNFGVNASTSCSLDRIYDETIVTSANVDELIEGMADFDKKYNNLIEVLDGDSFDAFFDFCKEKKVSLCKQFADNILEYGEKFQQKIFDLFNKFKGSEVELTDVLKKYKSLGEEKVLDFLHGVGDNSDKVLKALLRYDDNYKEKIFDIFKNFHPNSWINKSFLGNSDFFRKLNQMGLKLELPFLKSINEKMIDSFCSTFTTGNCLDKLAGFFHGSFHNVMAKKDLVNIENAVVSIYRQCQKVISKCDDYINTVAQKLKKNELVHETVSSGIHPKTNLPITGNVKNAYEKLTRQTRRTPEKGVGFKNDDIFYNQDVEQFIDDIESFKDQIVSNGPTQNPPRVNPSSNKLPSRMTNDNNLKTKIKSQDGHQVWEIDAGQVPGFENRGPYRIIYNKTTGEIWATPDHYGSFIKVGKVNPVSNSLEW